MSEEQSIEVLYVKLRQWSRIRDNAMRKGLHRNAREASTECEKLYLEIEKLTNPVKP